MPEGPEVRREADNIADAIVGKRLSSVEFGLQRLQPFADLLRGRKVIDVQTRGKALLTHFDNDYTMFSHNQLYGRWVVCRAGRIPPSSRSLRVGLHTQSHSALLYSASEIHILETRELDQLPFLRRLGPDVLDQTLDWRDISARLTEPSFRGRSLASLYLSQQFLAGIGNYLRSEILHEAALGPALRPKELTLKERGALARATLQISRRAYATGGVTNRPGRVRTLQRRGYTRRQYRFAVFDREGLPCYRCQRAVVRIEVGSRRLYFCPDCQPG